MNTTSYPASISAPSNTTPSQPATVHFQTGQGPGMPSPTPRGRPRGAAPATVGGAKRGRKPRTNIGSTIASPLSASPDSSTAGAGASGSQLTSVHWAPSVRSSSLVRNTAASPVHGNAGIGGINTNLSTPREQTGPTIGTSGGSTSTPSASSYVNLPGVAAPVMSFGGSSVVGNRIGTRVIVDEDGEGEDELLPAMADDDYSTQLSWQSQSKDNLKVLMENLSPAQYDRFEAYRRHALPKQAVRKVIQQSLGQQVSQPVAQIVAGFAKVFVGEIVEKARAVQARRNEQGPLSPDHLREAYRMYQDETGRVGAARPLRNRKLFVR